MLNRDYAVQNKPVISISPLFLREKLENDCLLQLYDYKMIENFILKLLNLCRLLFYIIAVLVTVSEALLTKKNQTA